jgi:DNA-binding transcriptional LysR family regulator
MPRTPLPWHALGLDLVTLRVLKAAAEERSLAGAAERERLALSAVSRRIAEMEARFGTALLRRHDRGVEPTAAGEALLRHIGPLFDLLGRAAADVEAFASGARGHVRLHANISAITGPLPEALTGFLAAHPGIEVSLEERLSSEILHAVRIGAADVGLVSATVQAPDLRLIPWREDRLMAVLPQDHPLLRHAGPDTALRFADLAAEPFVGLSPATALQQLYRDEAATLGLVLRERVNVASFDGVRRMVEAGLGVAVLPAAGAEPYVAAMAIAVRPLAEAWAVRLLALCIRTDAGTLSAAARLLVAHLLGRPRP